MRLTFTLAAGCLPALAFLAGCSKGEYVPVHTSTAAKTDASSPEAVKFLKWSMDQYQAMPAYRAEVKWSLSAPAFGETNVTTRTISFQPPNKYKVTVAYSDGHKLTSVSDGKIVVEYADTKNGTANGYRATDSIADVNSQVMTVALSAGTPLYKFFLGSGDFGALVDPERGPVTFGPDEKAPNGENAHLVKFYGQEQYGHEEMLIGEKSGHVYRIRYDSESLLQKSLATKSRAELEATIKGQIDKMKPGPKKDAVTNALTGDLTPLFRLDTEEDYKELPVGKQIDSKEFDTKLPPGIHFPQSSKPASMDGIPEGTQAPNIEVTSMDGKPIRLSSLRGKPVMIDFWATWCKPCIAGLPETARIAKASAGKSLQVLAVSDENPETISAFVKVQSYALPVYRDSNHKAEMAFKVTGLPTTVVIDAKGNVAAYLVGLRDPQTIQNALAKVGVHV